MTADGAAPSAVTCLACGGDGPPGMRFCGHCGRPLEAAVKEQRLVTALFADISGFTSLADRLDAERLDAIIGPVIGVLAATAERYGGTLAKYAGDAVLVFFGAPVAQEDHAQRALRCALDMHADLRAALPALDPEAAALELHIGVNSGRVVTGMFGGDIGSDYSILGDAVNVAQRLESVAPSGETYVGATTYDLASADVPLEPLGELTLKGKAAPVAAWRLAGAATARAPDRAGTGVMVGRDAELHALTDLVEGLTECGSVVLVVADPGAGKSRLAAEVRTAAQSRGVTWLEARSLSYGAGVPYWPFVDLVRRTLGVSIDQDPTVVADQVRSAPSVQSVPGAAPYLCRLLGLPSPDPAMDTLSPEAFQRGLGDAVEGWLSGLAAEAPVVLLVEDLHWLDTASLDLLQRVLRLTASAPVLLYLTGRPESADTAEALLADAAAGQVTQVRLAPLDRAQTRSVLAAVLGAAPGEQLLTMVDDRASGNPFFVAELARALEDAGGLERSEAGVELQAGFDDAAAPATVEGVLSARMDLLPSAAAQLLQTAAVIGRSVDLALLDHVADAPGRVPALLSLLVQGGFLDQHGDKLVFHHALLVDVAYGRLVRAQRVDLHRRVAEAAEVLYGTAEDVLDLLARHLYLAEAGVKAVDHLQRAAERAGRLYANDQCALHLGRAVELARRTPRVAGRLPSLLLALADVEDVRCEYDTALALYDEVRARSGAVEAWRGLAAVLRRQGRGPESVAVVEDGLRALDGTGQQLAPLWLERAATLAFEGNPAEAVQSALAGLAGADPASTVAAELLVRLARAQEASGDLEPALEHARQAEQVFVAAGDLRGEGLALRVQGGLLGQTGRGDEAVAVLHRGLLLAERTGSAEELGGCLLNLGYAEMTCGRVAEGAEHDERAAELFHRVGHLNGQATAHANLAEKLVLLGRLDDAERHLEQALELTTATGAQVTRADALRTFALLRHEQGRAHEAVDLARSSAAEFASVGDQGAVAELARTFPALAG